MNLRRLIISVYLLVFAGAAFTAGLFFLDAREEYIRLKNMEMQNQQKLADAQQKLEDEQKVLERLKTDPAYVQHRIEQELGFVKPDASVIRFEH